MAADKRKDLARRLRALADKLSASSQPPPAVLNDAGKALAEMERLFASGAEPSLQMRMALPEAPPPVFPAALATQATQAEKAVGNTVENAGLGAVGGPIYIWSDGSCAPNPGVGGWGAIVERDGAREELSGASPRSTNNAMEMTAAIEALRRTPPGAEVEVVTDSQYLKNGITLWVRGWKRKGWRKANGEPVLNQELWEALDGLVSVRKVAWRWTRGHSGHPENERCDELANQARLAISQ